MLILVGVIRLNINDGLFGWKLGCNQHCTFSWAQQARSLRSLGRCLLISKVEGLACRVTVGRALTFNSMLNEGCLLVEKQVSLLNHVGGWKVILLSVTRIVRILFGYGRRGGDQSLQRLACSLMCVEFFPWRT